MKIFVNVQTSKDINGNDFENFCLKPAMEKRRVVRRQINLIDSEFKEDLPDIRVK